MFRLLLLCLGTFLLAACNGSGSLKASSAQQNLLEGPFKMAFYNIRQPEKLLDNGEHERIAFGFIHSVRDNISGDELGVLWQGKIRQPETGTVTIQHSDADKLQIEINGKPIKLQHGGYTDVDLEKGSHDVQVRYEPKWLGGDMAVNFLNVRPRAPESVAKDIQAAASKNAAVAFAQVEAKMDGSALHPKDWQWRDAELFVPATDKPYVLVLSSRKLSNVALKLHEDAEIEAIVALNGIGLIGGSDAPVYRLAREIDTNWWPNNCRCTGGTHFHCSGSEQQGLPEIQALSQTLFGRTPHVYAVESEWYPADALAKRHLQGIEEYQKGKAQCGGSQALRFDNAVYPNNQTATADSGSLKDFGGEQSWLSKMGGTLPESGFDAYYFKHDGIGKPIAQENVPHIALNYPYKEFHNIDAEQFAALWAGYLDMKEDTAVDMQYDMNWAQLRVWLNGKKVFEHRHGQNGTSQEGSFDLIVPKGKNRLEVEYINHWHTVGFALHPQPKILNHLHEQARKLVENLAYETVHAKVYESANRDSSLPITLPESSKPIVLVLQSHNSVFWQIQPSSSRLQAVIMEDGKGTVSGSTAPVLRVKNLPKIQRGVQSFYEYDPVAVSGFK